MRKYYWYLTAFIRKHGALLIGTIIGGVVLFSVVFPFVINIFELRPRHYIGMVGSYSLNTLPRSIQVLLSHGLTELQPDGSVIPDVAERWAVEDEGKSYRFVVRRNVFWSDGKAFEPSDVNYNFSDVQTIATANDVIFKLKKPFVPFPTVVSQPLFRFSQQTSFFFLRKQKLIGLGPYQVNDYQEKGPRLSELTVSNKDEERVYRFYLTEDDAIAAFERGEVDELPDLANPGILSTWQNVTIDQTLDNHTYLGIFFNLEHPVFKDSKELRQALNYALEKPNDDTRVYGPISPQSWAFADVGKDYGYDLDRAVERLLAVKDRINIPLHFELTTTQSFSQDADIVKAQWEKLGTRAAEACQSGKDKEKGNCENLRIQVTVRINNFPDLNNFSALLIGQTIPADPDQYTLWHSQQRTNFTHYENTRIDALLERGRQTTDREKRKEIYHDFQQFFTEDGPVIYLRYLYKLEVKRK
jgi:peptide/nickel transport system substrate-binding protein